MAYQYYSMAGLALDMIGVAMLFNTGIPPKVDMFELYVEMNIKEELKPLVEKRERRARLALQLIVLGCVLQIFGTWLSF